MTSAGPEPTDEQHRSVDDETVRDAGFVVSGVAHLLPQAEWESLRLDVARALAAAAAAERDKYEAVRKLHTPGLHGGLDQDVKVSIDENMLAAPEAVTMQAIERAAKLLYDRFGDWRKTWKQAGDQERERFRILAREINEVLR